MRADLGILDDFNTARAQTAHHLVSEVGIAVDRPILEFLRVDPRGRNKTWSLPRRDADDITASGFPVSALKAKKVIG